MRAPMTTTMPQQAVARVRVLEAGDDQVIVGLPGTNYRLYLRPTAKVQPPANMRVKGMIRCPVWKVDFISAGGAFVEPVYGRPRRVQGRVITAIPELNAVAVDVWDTPIIGLLPERWQASEIASGTRVGLDVKPGSEFQPEQG